MKEFSEIEIKEARRMVAQDWRDIVKSIREENLYACHVSESTKINQLERGLIYADEIEAGMHDGNMTIAQRIHLKLTGNCIAILP